MWRLCHIKVLSFSSTPPLLFFRGSGGVCHVWESPRTAYVFAKTDFAGASGSESFAAGIPGGCLAVSKHFQGAYLQGASDQGAQHS